MNLTQNYRHHLWLSERAVLAAKNIDVNELNFTIQNHIPGEIQTYKSIDTILNREEAVNYPTEFLNLLDLPGMPPHNLILKKDVIHQNFEWYQACSKINNEQHYTNPF